MGKGIKEKWAVRILYLSEGILRRRKDVFPPPMCFHHSNDDSACVCSLECVRVAREEKRISLGAAAN